MEKKGDKKTTLADVAAAQLVDDLAMIDDITSKKMFGGYGIFHASKMFGIIDAKGFSFLKANEETLSHFMEYDVTKHSRMSYYSIPDPIRNGAKKFKIWVEKSIAHSKA